MKPIILIFLVFVLNSICYSQQITIDARVNTPQIRKGHLNMGNPGPPGRKIEVNNKYLTLGDQAILPVMGEIHPTRVKPENWEESILKMKANGINIIAFYIFWIHHEEIEGEFNWSGRYDVRKFVELCKKHDVWTYPRLGPWCHGEVRNGGLPDWIMKKENMSARTNDSTYQFYADRLYREISEQLDGLYYKQDGPIVGVQLENEYWRGKGGEPHILWLKATAQKYGIDVPMYTVTAWGAASLPQNEVIPLWGGYPTAPWNTDVKKIEHNESYLFKKPVNDESIGHIEQKEGYNPDYSPYPFLTCELGVGNQISEHRRPEVAPIDGMAIAISNIASGSNLPGYYVFTGGLNPVGNLTTLEEDRWESGYWNEYPDISYDFQAAISEAGEVMPAYHELKPLHYFLNDFGYLLAPMPAIMPNNNEGWDDLQYAFRTDGIRGFLFVSNYYRGHAKSTKKNVRFTIQLNDETVKIPQQAMEIPDSAVFIWPVNLPMGNVLLKQASTQLICNVQEGDTSLWFFKQCSGITPGYLFAQEKIKSIRYKGKDQQASGDTYTILNAEAGLSNPVSITTINGDVHRIFTLNDAQAKKFWHFKERDHEYAFLSTANLMIDDQLQVHAFSTNPSDTIVLLNGRLDHKSERARQIEYKDTEFQQWIFTHPNEEVTVQITKADLIDSVQWLQLNPEKYEERKLLYHKQFFKDFTLKNTADIRKAGVYILSGISGKIRVNNQWVNQEFEANEVAYLDLTGYIQKEENKMLFDFPFDSELKVMGALIEIEYYNSDKEYIISDTSWLSVEQYKIPAPWEYVKNKKVPRVLPQPTSYGNVQFTPNRYALSTEMPKSSQFKNIYLRINYNGNKAYCRLGNNLVADNYNNGTNWTINLTDLKMIPRQNLIVELEPWDTGQRIYLDRNHEQVMTQKPYIVDAKTDLENRLVFIIQ